MPRSFGKSSQSGSKKPKRRLGRPSTQPAQGAPARRAAPAPSRPKPKPTRPSAGGRKQTLEFQKAMPKKPTLGKGKPGTKPTNGKRGLGQGKTKPPMTDADRLKQKTPTRRALPYKKQPTNGKRAEIGPQHQGPGRSTQDRPKRKPSPGGRKEIRGDKPKAIGPPLRRGGPAPDTRRRKPGPEGKIQLGKGVIGKGVPEKLGGDPALGGPSRRKRIAARKAAPPRAKPTFDPRTTGQAQLQQEMARTKAARPSASSKRAKQTERAKPAATAKQTAKADRDRAQAARGDARRAAEKRRGIKKAAPAARAKVAPAKAKARATKPAAKKAAPKITARQRAIKTGQAGRTARARRKSKL